MNLPSTSLSNRISPIAPALLDTPDFAELDAILDDLRTRYDETPQWEFCEGFMAALVCCRRSIPMDEYLPVLLATPDADEERAIAVTANDSTDAEGSFTNDAQRERFMQLWTQRWNEVTNALDQAVETLEDERCYTPEVVDLRSALAHMTEEERANFQTEALPSFAQVWALGFMFAVEAWPEEWVAPRDKDAAKWLNASLQAIVAMTEADTGKPEISPLDGSNDTPSTSIARLNAFGDAIWATYDLREMWRTIGPRIEAIRKVARPGRNDLCDCGSGKKYKKCHGAG